MRSPSEEFQEDASAAWFEEIDNVLLRIQRAEKRLEALQKVYEAQKGHLLTKLGEQKDLLRDWMRMARDQLGRSDLEVPAGIVRIRKSPGRFAVLDRRAAMDAAKVLGAVRMKQEIDIKTLRGALQETEGGDLVTKEGEMVDWAKIEGKGEDSVSWKESESP